MNEELLRKLSQYDLSEMSREEARVVVVNVARAILKQQNHRNFVRSLPPIKPLKYQDVDRAILIAGKYEVFSDLIKLCQGDK